MTSISILTRTSIGRVAQMALLLGLLSLSLGASFLISDELHVVAAQVLAAAIEEMGNARVIVTPFDGLSRALAPEVEPGGTY